MRISCAESQFSRIYHLVRRHLNGSWTHSHHCWMAHSWVCPRYPSISGILQFLLSFHRRIFTCRPSDYPPVVQRSTFRLVCRSRKPPSINSNLSSCPRLFFIISTLNSLPQFMLTHLDLLSLVSCPSLMLMASYILLHFGPESVSLRNAITISMIEKCSPLSNASSTGITTSKDLSILSMFAPITRILKSSCLRKSWTVVKPVGLNSYQVTILSSITSLASRILPMVRPDVQITRKMSTYHPVPWFLWKPFDFCPLSLSRPVFGRHLAMCLAHIWSHLWSQVGVNSSQVGVISSQLQPPRPRTRSVKELSPLLPRIPLLMSTAKILNLPGPMKMDYCFGII